MSRTALPTCEILHPVEPVKLIGIGINYRDHAEESELDLPDVPLVFAMWPSALVGHGATIVIPGTRRGPTTRARSRS